MQVTIGKDGKPVPKIGQRHREMLTSYYEFVEMCGALTAFSPAATAAKESTQALIAQITGEELTEAE